MSGEGRAVIDRCFVVLGLLLASGATCLADKPLERPAAEVFAKMSVAAGQLAGMSGELDVHYSPRANAPGPGGAKDGVRKDHTARFWFAKPFRLRVDQVPDGIELYCADRSAALYLPDRKQVVEFDIGATGANDLLPGFFSLFTIPSFVQGALLPDVESQFETQVVETPRGWRLSLTPYAGSLYRGALGLTRIDAEVDRANMMPYRLELFEAAGLLCRIDLAKLEFNPKIAPSLFLYNPRPGVHRVASTDILKEWVLDALGQASTNGHGVMHDLQKKLSDFQKSPWDF